MRNVDYRNMAAMLFFFFFNCHQIVKNTLSEGILNHVELHDSHPFHQPLLNHYVTSFYAFGVFHYFKFTCTFKIIFLNKSQVC